MNIPEYIQGGLFGTQAPLTMNQMQQPAYYSVPSMQQQFSPFVPQPQNSPLGGQYEHSLPIGYIGLDPLFYRPEYANYIPSNYMLPLNDGTPVAYHNEECILYVSRIPQVFNTIPVPIQVPPTNQVPLQQPTTVNVGTTGYVFQPIFPNAPSPYGYNTPRVDYYNPFPEYQSQQFNYGYGYMTPYNNQRFNPIYSPFMSVQRREQMVNQQVNKEKLKVKIAMGFLDKTVTDEELDIMTNPNNPANLKSSEQVNIDQQWSEITRLKAMCDNPSYLSPEQQNGYILRQRIANFHQAFDQHSLCQFLEDDFPRLLREQWISENVKRNATRQLNGTYDSNDYNELLKMHVSSNPYINQLLDNSRYDNNKSDHEVGTIEILKQMRDRAQEQLNGYGKGLPTYISSPEVQAQRHQFIEELTSQLYQKQMQRPPDSAKEIVPAPIVPEPIQPLQITPNDLVTIDTLAKHGINLSG